MAGKGHALEKNLPGYMSTYEDHFRPQVPVEAFEEKLFEIKKPLNLWEHAEFGLDHRKTAKESSRCTCSKFISISLKEYEKQHRNSHPEKWEYLKNVSTEYEDQYSFEYTLPPVGIKAREIGFEKLRNIVSQAKKEQEEKRRTEMDNFLPSRPWVRKELLYDDELQCMTAQLYRAHQGTLILRKGY